MTNITTNTNLNTYMPGNEDLSKIFNLSPDLICISKPDGYFSKINPAWEKILGFTLKEVMEMGYVKLIHPDDIKQLNEVITKANGKETINFINRLLCKDGTYKYIEWNVTAVPDGNLYAIGMDISKRKIMEEKLKDSGQVLQSIIDLLPSRIFWKDINLKYLGCNKAFALDAGHRSYEEMLGKSDLDMNWREQADAYRADDMKIIKSGQPKLNYEEPQTNPAGKKIWLNTNKVPLKDASGITIGILGTYIDITEQKVAEEKLKENLLQLEKMNKVMVDRELKMVELKNQISELEKKLSSR